MTYRSPATIDITSILSPIYYLNEVTKGWFTNGILLFLFIATIFGYYKATKDLAEAFAVSSFFVVIVALFLWIADALSSITFTFAIGVSILGVFALLTRSP